MDLYHGTSKAAADNILEFGIKNRSRIGLDFGAGFYLTEDKHQAERWARRGNKKPSVLHFYLPTEKLAELNVKILNGFSAEWGHIMYEERVKQNDILLGYDIVIGRMADGRRLHGLIEDAQDGYITEELFTHLIAAGNIGSQVIAKTQRAYDCLEYRGRSDF